MIRKCHITPHAKICQRATGIKFFSGKMFILYADGGSMFLQNSGNHLPGCTISKPHRP
jgi:hypothetical protein